MTYRAFTLIVPYYDNPLMFREQQRQWRALELDVRQSLHVVVVDDGSPESPAADHLEPETAAALASFRLFRTGVDVRWNWLFCRNLGVEKATTDWVLMTDIDHVIPYQTWRRLMRDKLDPLVAYRFSRVVAPDHKEKNPHPNTWAMTRHMFLNRIGGYDELFSGVYGTDGEFAGRVALWAQTIHILSEKVIEYPPTVIADASTTRYTRKDDNDRVERSLRKSHKFYLGASYQPKRLTFPWSQVYP